MDFETEQRILDLEATVTRLTERVADLEGELRGAAEWVAEQKERES